MKNSSNTYLKIVKIIGIAALICTAILFTFLVVESSMTGETSGTLTSFITGKVDSSLDLSDKIEENYETQSIDISASKSSGKYYIGETIQLSITYYPAKTRDTEVEYSVDLPKCATVDQNGTLTFLNKNTVTVKAVLKSDPTIYDTISFWCVGEDVFDEAHPERKVFSLSGSGVTNNTIKKGKFAKINLNDNKTFVEIASLKVKDPSVAFVTENRVFGRSKGSTEITATLKAPDGTKETYTIPVTVEDSDYVPVSEIKFKDDVEIVDEKNVSDYRKLFVIEDGRTLDDYTCRVTSDNNKIVNISSYAFLVHTYGTVTFTFQSVYNPDLFFEKTIYVKPIEPESLTIVGADTVQPHSYYQYSAYHAPTKYSSAVKWSIVKGHATIDENGKLVATFFGDVTVRCQSLLDESLYVEKTIHVGFATSARGIVRKLMGHMGLHAVLGFGITFTLLFTLKRKRFTLLSPVICFASTCLTEFIQYFVPGRSCHFTDVITDFSGAVVGIVVAVIFAALILVVFRIVSKKEYKKVISAVKATNIKNLFTKVPKLQDENNRIKDEICAEETDENIR